MTNKSTELMPHVRSEGLVVKEVADELLIYDRERDRAHCLNVTAATIWRHCDGRTSVSEIARAVAKLLDIRFDGRLVHLALKQLESNKLLLTRYEPLSVRADLTRRRLIKQLGIGIALVPLITSITAPSAHAAISCGGPCTGGPGRGTCPAGCLCSVITNSCVAV